MLRFILFLVIVFSCARSVNVKREFAETTITKYIDGRISLHSAACSGNKATVEMFLKEGADKDKASASGATPMYMASVYGRPEVVKMLLRAGADKEKGNIKGETPLYVASEAGKVEVVRLLLEAGADKEKATNNGATPLYVASEAGKVEVVKMLLRAGADKEKATTFGGTPLLIASDNGHKEVVEILLKAGAIVNKVGSVQTPLHYSISNWNKKLDKIKAETTMLHIGVDKSYKGLVEILLAAGAVIDALDIEGEKPLYKAVKNGHPEVVDMLLEAGARVDEADKSGETPLYRAVVDNNQKVVEMLLKAGVKANIKLIVNAAERGHREVVEMLLASGGNVKGMNGKALIHYLVECDMCDKILDLNLSNEEMNVLSRYGRNVVHYAVASNLDVAAVRMLVEAGCKLEVKDNKGSLPIDIALKADNLELFTFLYERMEVDEEAKGLISAIKERVGKSKSKRIKSYFQQVEAVDVGETSDEVNRSKRKRVVAEDDPADEVVKPKKVKKEKRKAYDGEDSGNKKVKTSARSKGKGNKVVARKK